MPATVDVTRTHVRGALQALADQARLAPSGDNTQPWRFVVDDEHARLVFCVDETRDPSPMNAGQRMARIAVGAALETAARVAAASGWQASVQDASPPGVAALQLHEASGPLSVGEAVHQRVTNRRLYDARRLETAQLAELQERTPSIEGVRIHWIADRTRLPGLADLLARSDGLMFSQPALRDAFIANIRFDAEPTAAVDEGLSLGSLELGGADRFALRLLPRLPRWLVRLARVQSTFAAKARQLVESASGLCVISAADEAWRTDLLVGRAVQSAWIALTESQLAVQPMMSLPVLQGIVTHGPDAVRDAIGRDRVQSLGAEFRRLVPELGQQRLAFLMRFGYAQPPSGRTGRLPVTAVLGEMRSD